MVPAGAATDKTVEELAGLFERGRRHRRRRQLELQGVDAPGVLAATSGVGFVDAGTSGGVWGLTEGYCLMVGGTEEAVAVVEPAL